MKLLKKHRKLLIVTGLLLFLAVTAVYISNRIINSATKDKLYSVIEDIPHNKVGLLLGTGKYLANGSINPYYQFRIDATVSLIRAGKIDYLIISGDNSRKDYNEPQSMKEDLGSRGIDTSKVYLDYAGFRTFDSIIRLKEIFSQSSVTIISQPFHNQRAIYIAQREGISAIGFNAKDVSKRYGAWIQLREKLARVKVFVDILIGVKPRFLGNKVPIP